MQFLTLNHMRHRKVTSFFSLARAACGLVLSLLIPVVAAGAEPPSPEQAKFFETRVRPLLAEHCFQCHGAEQSKGNLRLNSRGHQLLGGDSGPAIVPGKPDESLLLQAVRYESYEMPPSGKLPDEKIAVLETWIRMGAPWPGDDGQMATRTAGDRFSPEDRSWWAIQPVRQPDLPEVKNPEWARTDIDRFILAAMESQSLTPAPEAPREKLIRRLYFDLIGLPPTPAEVRQFVESSDPQAYEKLVEKLLSSPEYGERWARHWLDLVRYAESDGYRIDGYRPLAWRYRDYVIASLNADKPYDRFVQEQIAGDELFPGNQEALVATGFLRHGIYEYNNLDVRGQWEVMQNELTDTTADVFLGLGLQCARCHDHKFDPLLQQDYYRLRAFFEALAPRDNVVVATPEQQAEFAEKQQKYVAEAKSLLDQIEEIEAKYRQSGEDGRVVRFPEDIQELFAKPQAQRTPAEQQLVDLAWRQIIFEHLRIDARIKGETKEQLLALRRQLAAYDALKPEPLPLAMIATDVGPVAPPTVIPKKKVEVQPGVPTLMNPEPTTIVRLTESPATTGRRAALAGWMTDPQNPLTPRVIVNRIWQYHFGRGLAPNSSDFGRLSGPPSHPELLDWMTTEFLRGGWRWKNLHRLIVNSATYRQSTNHPDFIASQTIDPLNQWYWRANTHRLDAEQIRDGLLQITGQLDRSRGGEGVLPDLPRRSIYTRIMRNARDPLLDAFDLPLFFSSASFRDTTTTPVQSLLLMNSPELLRHARELATQVLQPSSGDGTVAPDSRIIRLWEIVYGRPPAADELAQARSFLTEQQQRRRQQSQPSAQTTDVVMSKVPYRDGQALMFAAADHQPGPLAVPHADSLNVANFTIESYFQVRSIAESGAVRTLVSKWSHGKEQRGWTFGITGKGSRRKPQTLVLLIRGENSAGQQVEAALFSDHYLEINKPYYAGVSFTAAGGGTGSGTARFFLKDLSNDDEPLLTATIPHDIAGGFSHNKPLNLGSRGRDSWFDGLIDDVRLSAKALSQGELLTTSEGVASSTVGYWQFEPTPGMYRNTCSDTLNIQPIVQRTVDSNELTEAYVDLCHVLLNSNEFLYVD
ncbi:DUF1549 domain-containing protein [Planctomicrobium sp. SH664]|uniref:PSD1 and planctomycete cytochrome C domain-containing protein n=1 Tax=Planctomicrobium sp. SH664 TaxID=3448125 RepID=UPI003F5C7D7B